MTRPRRLGPRRQRHVSLPDPRTAAALAPICEWGRRQDDTDARRFYARHGYVNSEPGEDPPRLYYYRELNDAS